MVLVLVRLFCDGIGYLNSLPELCPVAGGNIKHVCL